ALRLTIRATKRSFVLPEPVLILVRLRNTAPTPIRIWGHVGLNYPDIHPVLRHVGFQLFSPSGRKLPLLKRSGFERITYENGLDMQPSEAVTQTFNLLSFYHLKETGHYKLLA